MREREIFAEAIEKTTAAERAAYLDGACRDEPELRQRVEALIAEHDKDGSFFLDSPAAGATTDQHILERPGDSVGVYKLLQKIGEGGFGVVYMAEQQKPVRRKVALKIIKPGMDTKDVVARFEAERQALALMDHPNVAKVLDAGATVNGRPYFVMELVKGVPLTEFCDSNQLSMRDRLELFVAVCRAVQHAHQKGIIHRDLKPSNVMVTLHDNKPVPKVIDFGVSKAISQQLTEKTLFTAYGQMIGTPQYMSPEQAQMSALDIDTRSDIYSLGVLLYELLTGGTPLEAERLRGTAYAEMQRLIREEEPPKPSTRLSTRADALAAIAKQRGTDPKKLGQLVRGDLDWIVMKAIEKERNRRYSTASSFAEDVERFLHDEAVEARPPSAVYRFRKFARRNKTTVVSLTALASVLMITALVSMWQAAIARNERNRALRAQQQARQARDAEIQQHELARAEADRAKQAERSAVEMERALQELLGELRVELMDKVFVAIMSGDESRAETAIEKARQAGVPDNWIRIFHGQLALYYGRPDEAIDRLREVAPESVAAQGMLAVANLFAGRLEECEYAIFELQERLRTAKSLATEDRLFAGQALIQEDAIAGTELIERAKDERDSALARMFHADGLAHVALHTGDKDAIKRAPREIEVAMTFLGDTPFLLAVNLWVEHVAVATGLDGELSIAEVRGWAENVKDLPVGRMLLVRLLADLDPDESVKQIEAWTSRPTDFEMLFYVPNLLQHKPPADVLAFIEASRCDGPYTQCWEARVMAIIPDRQDEARRLCRELVKHHRSFAVRNACLTTLLLLGNVTEVRRLSAELLDSSTAPFWHSQEVMQYLANPVDSETFLYAAEGSRVDQHEALYAIAINQLAENKRDEAVDSLQKCVAMNIVMSENYWWARTLLHLMETDPAWPTRIGRP